MTEVEEYQYKLQGRVLACETIQTALLMNYAMVVRPHDPLGGLASLKIGIQQGLQHSDHRPSPENDLIWESMAQGLDVAFSNAREKLETIVGSRP